MCSSDLQPRLQKASASLLTETPWISRPCGDGQEPWGSRSKEGTFLCLLGKASARR
jgi:hypothetical protein